MPLHFPTERRLEEKLCGSMSRPFIWLLLLFEAQNEIRKIHNYNARNSES
jgi:hypothetical protein